MSHQIYGLYDPSLAYLIRYVGYTAKDLEARLIEHIAESNYHRRSHRHKWIRSLLRRGVRPAIVSLEAEHRGVEDRNDTDYGRGKPEIPEGRRIHSDWLERRTTK